MVYAQAEMVRLMDMRLETPVLCNLINSSWDVVFILSEAETGSICLAIHIIILVHSMHKGNDISILLESKYIFSNKTNSGPRKQSEMERTVLMEAQ